MENLGFIWDSEAEKPSPTSEDVGYLSIDDRNGCLIIANYNLTGSRTTVVLFLGPEAERNAQNWSEWCEAGHDEMNDLNTDTKTVLRAWLKSRQGDGDEG